MTLENKFPLPDAYIQEMEEYQRILNKYNRTTSGQATFTNSDTLASYTTVGSPYDNQGEDGLSKLLFNESPPKLSDYIYADTDYSEMVSSINQSLNLSTLNSGTNIVMNVTTPTDDGLTFKLEIPNTITGGNITIIRNGQTAYNLYSDYALTENVTEIEAGIYDFIQRGTAFQLASSGVAGNVWLQQYTGANKILKNDKDKDVAIKTGEYAYNEFYSTKIIGNDQNPTYRTWDETIPTSTDQDWFLGICSDDRYVYAPEGNSPYRPLRYDTVLREWDETLTGKGGFWGYSVHLKGSIYAYSDFGENFLAIYNINSNSWSTSSSSARTVIHPHCAVGDDIYCGNNTDEGMTIYHTPTNTWTYGAICPLPNWSAGAYYNGKIYVSQVSTGAMAKYDIELDSWELMPTATNPDALGSTAVVVEGRYHIRDSSRRSLAIYDIESDSWDQTSPTIVYASVDEVCSIGNKIYASAGTINKLFEFDAQEKKQQIIPPTTQATDQLKSLLHMDGTDGSTTFTDETGIVWTANGNAQIDTAQSKFGGASALFDGTGDWIDTPANDGFNLGTNDFTIDFWAKKNANGVDLYMCGQSDSVQSASSLSIYVRYNTTNNIVGYTRKDSGANLIITGSSVVTDTNWHHIALVRNGDSLSLYLDGNVDATGVFSGDGVQNSTATMSIGRIGDLTTNTFNGHIDEFRFVNGTAKWTSNFTPPTQAYVYEDEQELDIQAKIDGTLEMASPEIDQVYQGFISKVNLWNTGIEGNGFSNIKQVQRGTATIVAGTNSVNVTISEVDLTKSIVKITFNNPTETNTYGNTQNVSAEITSTTNVQLRTNANVNSSMVVSWEVIEFNNVKSIQTGITTVNTSAAANISSIDMDKSILFTSFRESIVNGYSQLRAIVNTSTQLIFYVYQPQGIGTTSASVYWQVIEFN